MTCVWHAADCPAAFLHVDIAIREEKERQLQAGERKIV
jgi:hypothetical protein